MMMRQIEVARASRAVDITVSVPGSKSITNRALICAALAEGESRILRSAPGDDSAVMIDALRQMGIGVEMPGSADQASATGASVEDNPVTVRGTGGRFTAGPLRLSAGLAGTTSRFLTAVCVLGKGPYVIDGEPPLRARPMGPLQDALRQLGAQVVAPEGAGSLPVEVTGGQLGGAVRIRGDVSSQYLTALMLIGPLLPRGLEVDITTSLVSRPYVELTASVMRSFGVVAVEVEDRRITVEPGRYQPTEYRVEPDASSASYPLALAALVGGRVTIDGLGTQALQGDAQFADLLGQMGCKVQWSAESVSVSRSAATPLTGLEVDMAHISDLVPTLAVVASVAASPSRITGVGFVRGKESDRLGDLAAEMRKLGVEVLVEPDGLSILPSGIGLHGGLVQTHHDHRLAMAFGVLGARLGGVSVQDPGVVTKSWPGFWEALESWTQVA